jgi:hypothetical protein
MRQGQASSPSTSSWRMSSPHTNGDACARLGQWRGRGGRFDSSLTSGPVTQRRTSGNCPTGVTMSTWRQRAPPTIPRTTPYSQSQLHYRSFAKEMCLHNNASSTITPTTSTYLDLCPGYVLLVVGEGVEARVGEVGDAGHRSGSATHIRARSATVNIKDGGLSAQLRQPTPTCEQNMLLVTLRSTSLQP